MKGLLVGLVAAAAIIAACSSNDTTSTPPVVASVTMVPASDSAQVVTDTMLQPRVAQLAAVLKDAQGNVLSVVQTGQTVTWTSSAPTVATVDRYGLVKGVVAGPATITATIESQSGTSAVKVISVSVAAVGVRPSPDTVAVGSSKTLRAAPTTATGDTLVAKSMFWTSSDTLIAKVTNTDSLGVAPGNSGVVSGVAVGTATITARISGISGTATVVVKP